jgi:hypothetical protein
MRLLVSTAAVPARGRLTAVSALWIAALRLLFVATRSAALTAVAALTVAAVLRWRTAVGAWLLAAMWLLSEVATWWVV